MEPHSFAEFGKVLVALLIVIDPIGALPVMVGLGARMDRRDVRRIAIKIIGGSTILLLFFTATGTWVLRLFGITLADLRIGGGLLLLLISLKMVTEGRVGLGSHNDYRAAIMPLISPLLVGPGAITASVVLAGIHSVWFTSLAVIAAMLTSLLIFLSANAVERVIGDSGIDLVTRIMGLLVATIAISYMRLGIIGAIRAAGG